MSMEGGVLSSIIIVIPFFATVVAGCIKVGIRMADPHFDRKYLMSSGGMPSAHATFMAALTTAVALKDGLFTPLTTVTLCFAGVVMYDAMNIRYEGGKHARALNILRKTSPNTPEFLKEHLGHTPWEVLAGGCLGVVLGALFYLV